MKHEIVEDYYKILGITPKATMKEVKRAYRQLVKECHPDINPGKENIQKMVKINQAYEILGDISKRREYDKKYIKTSCDKSTGVYRPSITYRIYSEIIWIAEREGIVDFLRIYFKISIFITITLLIISPVLLQQILSAIHIPIALSYTQLLGFIPVIGFSTGMLIAIIISIIKSLGNFRSPVDAIATISNIILSTMLWLLGCTIIFWFAYLITYILTTEEIWTL
jgi:hypothetical protein